ncbi:MAG TPA: ATP-grasp domain-containing protein [Gammaproteobacteria bacterium]
MLVLYDERAADGAPDVQDALVQAAHVADALAELGVEAETMPVGLDLAPLERRLASARDAAVFNLVESLGGRAALIHLVPTLLEALGVPFTGCAAAAQRLSSNKLLAKRRLVDAGLPTPELVTASARGGPWIVKSVWEHASVGIDDASVVADARAAAALIEKKRAELGGEWFAERYVPGRELNVALLATPEGVRTLPVAEIEFDAFPEDKPRIVGYAAKWDPESFEYRSTPRRFGVEPELAARAAGLAVDCWNAFGLGGYARVDFRVGPDGTPSILEINANPCLAPDAGFAAALAAAEIPFATAVSWLLADAARRGAPRSR